MNLPETPDEMAAFIIAELQRCQDVLPPLVPSNGRIVDGEHASACALRSMATAMQLREAITALRAERDEARDTAVFWERQMAAKVDERIAVAKERDALAEKVGRMREALEALVAARDGIVSGMADRTEAAAELARAVLADDRGSKPCG